MLEHYRQYELELSSDCNAACPLCIRTRLNMPLRGNNNLSFDLLYDIFKDEEMEGVEMKFCGVSGDPILNPELFQITKFFSDKKCKVFVSTNGGINNVDWWKEYAQIPKVGVDFCIDGHEHTNHIYRQNVKWQNVIRNLEAFVGAGGDGRWQFISFEHNQDDLPVAQAHAERLGIRFTVRTSGRNVIWAANKKLKTKKKEVQKVMIRDGGDQHVKPNDMSQIKSFYKASAKGNYKLLDSKIPTIVCKHVNTPEIYISASGDVWPCCYIADNAVRKNIGWLKNYAEGWNSLHNHNIMDILDNDFFKNLKSRWYSEHPEYIQRCILTCGDKGSYLVNKKVLAKEIGKDN